MRDTPSDFLPTTSLQALQLRAKLLKQVRKFFDDRGFLEVETPLLSADTVVDRHIDPLSVILFDSPDEPQQGRSLWLQTSPEFCMKRLLAGGAKAIYQITRAFRGGEQGDHHNPEFTILEWYRVGDDLAAGIDLLGDFCEALLGHRPLLMSYAEAFEKYAGLNPHTASIDQMQSALRAAATELTDRDEWLNLLLATRVEPELAKLPAVILHSYPASQAALAKINGDPPVAERFELYAQGLELANGYHELQDADELLARNHAVNQLRLADGKQALPAESKLLDAMKAGLPHCAGVAVGFDRLLMATQGLQSIKESIAFPIDRA